MSRHARRRGVCVWWLAAAVIGGGACPAVAGKGKETRSPRTYVYKTVGTHQIKTDVWGAAPPGAGRPVVMTIHGGALIMGGRSGIRRELFDPLLDRGFVIVSIDYRLAPETKLPEIIDDVKDAYRWIREKGPALFGADADRIGVHGGSAGGYLTLMAGCNVEPRPKALAAYYGYGDVVGAWYSKPDPFYRRQPLVSAEDARSVVGNEVLSGFPQSRNRFKFYLYCRQNGLWPKEVAGLDPKTNREAFEPYCPVQNVTGEYPPTLLCHGDRDTDVPYEQSVLMAGALARAAVPYEFIPLQGAGHGFSQAKPDDVRRAIRRTVAFLVHYVEQAEQQKRR